MTSDPKRSHQPLYDQDEGNWQAPKDLPPERLPQDRLRSIDGALLRVVSLPPEASEWHEAYGESERTVFLSARGRIVDTRAAAMSVRVKRALAAMPEVQRELLVGYYMERSPWGELRLGQESRQAFHERLGWARKSFLREWVEHAADPAIVREEDF